MSPLRGNSLVCPFPGEQIFPAPSGYWGLLSPFAVQGEIPSAPSESHGCCKGPKPSPGWGHWGVLGRVPPSSVVLWKVGGAGQEMGAVLATAAEGVHQPDSCLLVPHRHQGSFWRALSTCFPLHWHGAMLLVCGSAYVALLGDGQPLGLHLILASLCQLLILALGLQVSFPHLQPGWLPGEPFSPEQPWGPVASSTWPLHVQPKVSLMGGTLSAQPCRADLPGPMLPGVLAGGPGCLLMSTTTPGDGTAPLT